MADLSDSRIAAARALGNVVKALEPRASAARYDSQKREIVVELTNGATFMIPSVLIEGLSGASDADLANVEILGAGYGLHWDSLDVDFTVPGLLTGMFGTKSYMARLAGQARSPAKSIAARENGAKGGRPRKAAAL
jgi:Protein of unknown function (DUF2442)